MTATPAVQAQTGTVLFATPNGLSTGSCSSWATACSLQRAIEISSEGRQIWVKFGVYKPGANRSDSFRLKNGVAVYGGFQGSEAWLDQRNWKAYPTVLSGDLLENDLDDGSNTGDNAYHVVRAESVNESAILDGFTIRSGNANGIASNGSGGGVHIRNASPILRNLVLTRNHAINGGGISVQTDGTGEVTPLLQDLTFTNNTAQNGGGAFCSGVKPFLYNTLFEGNQATSGGGLHSEYGCVVNLYNAAFTRNQASQGGAARTFFASMIMINNTISGNVASLSGGGIYKEGSLTLTIINSILWKNYTGQVPNQIDETSTLNTKITTNIIQGGYPGGLDNRNLNPLFVADPSPGPDGLWGTGDDQPGNLLLRYESPAIDTGNTNEFIAPIDKDLRGWQRLIDHPRPDTPVGLIIDLGAYEAGIIFVRKGAIGVANGSSWNDAFPELSNALAFAQAGDEVWVAAGVYRPGPQRSDTFRLKTDQKVYGGFYGIEVMRSERNIFGNPTILSGDIGTVDDSADNSYHVLSGEGLGPATVMDGFTIRGGNASGPGPGQNQGGGLYLRDSNQPSFANLVFNGNRAEQGGGIFSSQSSARFDSIQFINNQAQQGAGLYDQQGSLSFNQVVFQENTAGQEGGGIYSRNAASHLTNARFIRNSAVYGAGLYNESASPVLLNAFFQGNVATRGAGMYNTASTPDLSNALFTGNRATQAGGIYNTGSAPMLRNLTLVGNEGGALYFNASPSNPPPILVNSIVWNNSARPVVISGGNPAILSSLLEGGCPSQAICQLVRSTNPRLTQPPDKGPDGVWGTPDDNYGDARLLPSSPAIDSGNNEYVHLTTTTDLTGQSRLFDDPSTDDTGIGLPPLVDMGGYERHLAHSATTILSIQPAVAVVGQEVTISFRVDGNDGPIEGQVTVSDGTTSCQAPAGQGQCTLVFLSGGQKRLVARYSGSPLYDPSESGGTLFNVERMATRIELSIPAGRLTTPGEPVRAVFTVTPLTEFAVPPIGSVTVSYGTGGCTADISLGFCLLTFPERGKYQLTATYSGDTAYQPSTSLAIEHLVFWSQYLPLIAR